MRKTLASITSMRQPLEVSTFGSHLLLCMPYRLTLDDHEETAPVEEAVAEEAGPVDDYLELLEAQGDYAPAYDFFTTSMLWTVIAAALVFLMHLGFATLESGLASRRMW